MSHMFDKYDKEFKEIPDNQIVYLENSTEYKDKIVIGSDNEHTFSIPYTFEELKYLTITYVQGTEKKLTYEFDMNEFVPANDETTTTIYEYIYPKYNAKLYLLSQDEIDQQVSDSIDNDEITYCVLYYRVNFDESLMFNGYNKNVYVQMRVELDPNTSLGPDDLDPEGIITEQTKIYKVQIIDSLSKGVRNG